MDPPPTGKRGLFGWSDLLRYRSILGRGWNLQNYIGICWNPPDLYQIELNMLRFGRISTRSSRISMRSRQISKRSGHFSTNWTKTTGETLPSMENDYFSDVIQSGQFFLVFHVQTSQPTCWSRVLGVETRRRPITGVESAGSQIRSTELAGWVSWRVDLDNPYPNAYFNVVFGMKGRGGKRKEIGGKDCISIV